MPSRCVDAIIHHHHRQTSNFTTTHNSDWNLCPSYFLHPLNNLRFITGLDHGCKRIPIKPACCPTIIYPALHCLSLLAEAAQLTDSTTIQLASKLAAAGPPPPGGYGAPPPQGGYPPQQGQKSSAYVCFSPLLQYFCIHREILKF